MFQQKNVTFLDVITWYIYLPIAWVHEFDDFDIEIFYHQITTNLP